MNHEQALADIERRVRANGTPLDEVDRRVAEELGVPPDYHFAYWLVWAAIEARTQTSSACDQRGCDQSRAVLNRPGFDGGLV